MALGYTVVQRGFKELGRIGGATLKAVGPQGRVTKSLPDFDRIQAGGIFDVDVSLGTTPSVVVEAPQDLLPHLQASVNNGTLNLGWNVNFNLNNDEKIRAHVVTRRLRGATISGAGKMVINGKINENSFDANTSGAASLRLSASVDTFRLEATGASKAKIDDLGASNLHIQASGAAQCDIVGSVNTSSIDASGASHIQGRLVSNRAEIQTSGAAHAVLRVMTSLKGEATGASSITYSGRPSQVIVQTSGVARVNKANG